MHMPSCRLHDTRRKSEKIHQEQAVSFKLSTRKKGPQHVATTLSYH